MPIHQYLSDMKLSALILATLSLFTVACSSEHEACFTVINPEFVCPGVPVGFINCGPAGDVYHWNFGDGSTFKASSVAHTFTTADTFKVYLAAGTGNKAVRDSVEILCALPRGMKLTLQSMPTLAPDGQPWDPTGSNADVRLWIFDEFNSTIFNTNQFSNISLPFEFDLSGTELCKDCRWRMLLLDSQSGGDFDDVWEINASYDSLASKRIHTFTSANGAVAELVFEPN
jgi:hypothetical protein